MPIITRPAASKPGLAERLQALLGQTYHKPPQPAKAKDSFGLDPHHYKKVVGSGLTRETVNAAQLYSEYDTAKLRSMLNSRSVVAPALIFPHFDRFGRPTEYNVARPSNPRTGKEGKDVKYEMPAGQGNRAYFPPLPIVWKALRTPGEMVLITEGSLKALASSQAGLPCIGLMGVWNWVIGGSDPKILTPDLAEIDWRGRIVLIVFDFDRKRNPHVNHAEAELARVLTEQGADVRILRLPPGPRGPNGRPMKQAIDDFIRRRGEDAFRQWVKDQLVRPPVRSLTDWRQETCNNRVSSLGQSGVNLDTGPTGAGKSFADAAALKRLGTEGRSVILVPTHLNCRQVEKALWEQDIEPIVFPQLTGQTCLNFEEASAVIRRGLVLQKVVCPNCEYADRCEYLAGCKAAIAAQHCIATLKRGEIQMHKLTKGRDYVSIHENAADMLRPQVEATTGFLPVKQLAHQAGMRCTNKRDRSFCRRMAEIARDLHGRVRGVDKSEEISRPQQAPYEPTKQLDEHLWSTMRELGIYPPGDALALVRMAAAGQLDLVFAMVDEREISGKTQVRRSIVGRSKTELPRKTTVWINDATANRPDTEMLLGRPVTDKTPSGRIAHALPVLQIRDDVKQSTAPSVVAKILRGMLLDLPHERVGVITHKRLCEPIRRHLGAEYGRRIAMMWHFRGGQSRGSNEWIASCDALIVLGTPRVPPSAIRSHLVRLGKLQAARMGTLEAGWSRDYWSGMDESGNRKTVPTLHYTDHDWHAAYCSLVVSELKQALGRARSILKKEGIPAYLVTKEDLGEALVAHQFVRLTDVQSKVLCAMYNGKGRPFRTAPTIATLLGISRPWAYKMLCQLREAGKVRMYGKRWLASSPQRPKFSITFP